ncbi:hypothetical protein C8Q75DRAFT_473800 [Abortiporus biennis]|nr:hypothetical protein C8Q75DRAFT_473800 [Abortiporus biennis]
MEELLQRNHGWIETELRSQWRIELRLRSPRLPLELLKLVIDNLWGWDDTATLANCCLTCHEFLRWSHDYLYEHVAFSEREQIKSFFDSLSRFPYLRRLTTNLHLSKVEACTEFLLHGLPLLPNLQSVTLRNLHSPLHPSLTSIGHPFHSVRILEFFSCTFQSVLDLRRLIDSFFPNVTYLALYSVTINSSHLSLPPIRPQKKPLSLSHLQSYFLADVVVRWLSWAQTPNTLNSLSIRASDLAKMLPSFCRRLQLLKVAWDMHENDLDESECTSHLARSCTFKNGSMQIFHSGLTYCQCFKRSASTGCMTYLVPMHSAVFFREAVLLPPFHPFKYGVYQKK